MDLETNDAGEPICPECGAEVAFCWATIECTACDWLVAG